MEEGQFGNVDRAFYSYQIVAELDANNERRLLADVLDRNGKKPAVKHEIYDHVRTG